MDGTTKKIVLAARNIFLLPALLLLMMYATHFAFTYSRSITGSADAGSVIDVKPWKAMGYTVDHTEVYTDRGSFLVSGDFPPAKGTKVVLQTRMDKILMLKPETGATSYEVISISR